VSRTSVVSKRGSTVRHLGARSAYSNSTPCLRLWPVDRWACRPRLLATAHPARTIPTRIARIRIYPRSDHRLAFLTRLRCQGNESRVEDCSAIGGNISCGSSYTAFLDCPNIQNATEQNTTMWEYRLADGASSVVGRVQARPTPNASWGTVCGGLPAYSTAAVACRSLNLADHEANYYHVRGTGPFPSAAQPIYFNDAGCVGSELSFDRCRLSAQPPAYCTHVDDLIATCEPNSGSWFYRAAGDNATVRFETSRSSRPVLHQHLVSGDTSASRERA
jgi:hypothetical protein